MLFKEYSKSIRSKKFHLPTQKQVTPNNIMAVKKTGKKKSDTNYKIITIRVTEDLLKRIQGVAAQSGLSANHLINGLIESGLDLSQENKGSMKLPKFLKMLRVMTESDVVEERVQLK